jgi:biotin transport system substrate-specific component
MSIALPRIDRSPADQRGITIADFFVPIRVAERMGTRVRHLALVIAGALFVALCSQVYLVQSGQTIPLIADFRIHLGSTPVPITGQTFGVVLVGGALGFRRGAVALLLYHALAVFLPFYSEGKSGFDTILAMESGGFVMGTTGGYLIGFVFAAAVTGRLAELGWDRRLGGALAAMFVGNVVIYLFGLPWLHLALQPLTGGSGWDTTISAGLTPFLIVDLLKLGLAALVFPAAWWLVGRRPDEP